MGAPRFIDGEGRILYRAETNKHHLNWRSDWYRTPQERKFREGSGMILRLSIVQHNELHANVPPPHKPNPDLMRDIHRAARNMDWTDPYDHFVQITHYLAEVAHTSTTERHVHDASLLLENYQMQAPFIELGRVTLLPKAA